MRKFIRLWNAARLRACRRVRQMGCLVIVGALMLTGCRGNSTTSHIDTKGEGIDWTMEQLGSAAGSRFFRDIYTDKSMYAPGDTVNVICELFNPEQSDFSGRLKLCLTKNGQTVDTKEAELSIGGIETASQTLSFTLPQEDFIGYAVEAYILDGENTLQGADMTAVDCSSDWRVYPRFGFVAGSMSVRDKEKSREILMELNKHHINTLYYQDMMDSHDTPLAGTVDQPADSYKTLAGHTVNRQTLLDMLEIGSEMNMQSFAYNLMFGAYEDCTVRGVSLDWGLYKDASGSQIDYHGPLPSNWETVELLLMNPGNSDWQAFYTKAMNDFVTAYPFDGIIVDSLGNRGARYDKDGNSVSLADEYASFLRNLKTITGKPLLFNPVDGYGYSQTVEMEELDFYYMEVWPWTYKTYQSLWRVIEEFNSVHKGTKAISLGAYMNYEYAKNGASQFNEPGVRYTNAVIMAAGGSHMELGDRGMLSSEYYPGDHLAVSSSLEAATRNGYSFMTAYQHLLRGEGWELRECETTVNGKGTSSSGSAGKIWAFAKQNTLTGARTLHTINLSDVKSESWVDNEGNQPAPQVLANQTVRHYVDGDIQKVLCMTPDAYEGISVEVSFTVGTDKYGQYVEFVMPHLEYWTMTVFL